MAQKSTQNLCYTTHALMRVDRAWLALVLVW